MICLRQRCRAKKAFWSSHLIGQIQTNSDIWLVRRILYLTVLNGFIPDSYVFLFYSRAFTCDILFSFWKASRRSTAGWLLIKKRNLKLFPWERNEKEVDKKYMRQLICWGRKCLLPQHRVELWKFCFWLKANSCLRISLELEVEQIWLIWLSAPLSTLMPGAWFTYTQIANDNQLEFN